jgi:hypothetical protein
MKKFTTLTKSLFIVSLNLLVIYSFIHSLAINNIPLPFIWVIIISVFVISLAVFSSTRLQKVSITTLIALAKIPLFLALGFAAYYSAEYNPILILPITAIFIGYALVLTFARESGNVQS